MKIFRFLSAFLLFAVACMFPGPAMAADFCLGGCPAGAPASNKLVTHHVLMLSANPARKNADWVAYIVSRDTVGSGCGREWQHDPALSRADSPSPADYDGAAEILHTDRGHQAPLASLCGLKNWREADFLSNITPQKKNLNRGAWKRLESAVRRAASKQDLKLHVVTGPVYSAHPTRLTARLAVSVPDSYWKAISWPSQDGIRAVAFLMPQNAPLSANYCQYTTAINDIQRATGLTLFPAAPPRRVNAPADLAMLGCR